jgi:hypothetical protein
MIQIIQDSNLAEYLVMCALCRRSLSADTFIVESVNWAIRITTEKTNITIPKRNKTNDGDEFVKKGIPLDRINQGLWFTVMKGNLGHILEVSEVVMVNCSEILTRKSSPVEGYVKPSKMYHKCPR